MDVRVISSLDDCSFSSGNVRVYLTGNGFSTGQQNQIKRLERQLGDKHVDFVTGHDTCLSDTAALLLIDSKNQLRGTYALEQLEVNRLLVELDIVYLNENYDQGVSR